MAVGNGTWFSVVQLTLTDPDWKAYPIPELDGGWSEHVMIINPTIFMVKKKHGCPVYLTDPNPMTSNEPSTPPESV